MNTWTRITIFTTLMFLGQSFSLQPARAQDDDAAALISIIDAIAKGWEQADGTPFRDNFLDFEGARYIESGGQNAGLNDLITHHVEPEGDSLDSLDLSFSNIETHFEGDFAWAIAATEIKATLKTDKRVIHNRGYETFLFRRVDGEWKVVHTHSSSRPVTKEASQEHSESHD
jgi:SnoaL-like protein